MKEKMKLLSLPLSIFYLFVSVVSCVPSDIDSENLQLEVQARRDAVNAVALYKKLNSLTAKSTFNAEGLTQETIDEYLVSAGFQPGVLTVETVSQIVSELAQKQNGDFESEVQSMLVSPYVKQKLIEMEASGFIKDLQNEENFSELSKEEKVILLNSNALVQEFSKAAQQGDVTAPCPSEACTFSMLLLGASIGTAVCGPLCGFFGGVIGLMVGTSLKD